MDSPYFTAAQVAALLGMNPVSVRRWRALNKKVGAIKHGPPYEFRGRLVVYPKKAFYDWCASVKLVGGVPHMNLPVSAVPEVTAELEQLATVKDVA